MFLLARLAASRLSPWYRGDDVAVRLPVSGTWVKSVLSAFTFLDASASFQGPGLPSQQLLQRAEWIMWPQIRDRVVTRGPAHTLPSPPSLWLGCSTRALPAIWAWPCFSCMEDIKEAWLIPPPHFSTHTHTLPVLPLNSLTLETVILINFSGSGRVAGIIAVGDVGERNRDGSRRMWFYFWDSHRVRASP